MQLECLCCCCCFQWSWLGSFLPSFFPLRPAQYHHHHHHHRSTWCSLLSDRKHEMMVVVGGKGEIRIALGNNRNRSSSSSSKSTRDREKRGEREKRKSNPIASHDLLWHADCCCCCFLFCRQTPRHSKMKISNFFFISSENWRLAVLDRSPPVHLTSPHLLTCNPSPLCLLVYTVLRWLETRLAQHRPVRPNLNIVCPALHCPPTFSLHHHLTDRILMMDRGPWRRSERQASMNQAAAAAVVVVGVRAKYVNLRIHQKTIYNKLRRMEGGSVCVCVRACV